MSGDGEGVGWVEIDALTKAGDVAGLAGALADPAVQKRSSMRAAVARRLGRTGSRHAVGPLAGLLEDSSADVRYAAVVALGETAAPDAVPFLIERLRAEDYKERCWAAQGLGKAGGEDAITALLEAAVADPERVVRSYAVDALADLRARRAIPTLIGLLQDPSRSLRDDAWMALVAIGDEDGVAVARRHFAEVSPLRRLILRYVMYGRDLERPW